MSRNLDPHTEQQVAAIVEEATQKIADLAGSKYVSLAGVLTTKKGPVSVGATIGNGVRLEHVLLCSIDQAHLAWEVFEKSLSVGGDKSGWRRCADGLDVSIEGAKAGALREWLELLRMKCESKDKSGQRARVIGRVRKGDDDVE